jgi:hypothetical protein
MRARDFIFEIGRRDILKGLAGAAALSSVATGAQAGEYQDITRQDPEILVKVWAPRMQQLQQQSDGMLAKLIRTAGPQWAQQLQGATVAVKSNRQYIQSDPENRYISIDLTVFWDAPPDVLAFAIAHELGHIALGHTDEAPSAEKSRQDEMDADDFAVRLCKALGYNKAGVFQFMHTKKGELEYMKKLASQPNSTHPTYDQRMDRARQQGFQLSQGGVQQMNALITHLS